MRLDQALRDGQADAAAAAGATRARAVGAVKTVEDVGEMFGRDAHPRIRHADRHLVAVTNRRNPHFALRRRVLQRVADEIEQHLPDAVLVRLDERKVGRQAGGQGHALLLELASKPRYGGGHQLRCRERPEVQPERIRLDAAEFLQIVHQTAQPVSFLINLPKGFIVGGQDSVNQALHRTLDGRERRAQLVGHVADQLAAHRLDLFELAGHRVETVR